MTELDDQKAMKEQQRKMEGLNDEELLEFLVEYFRDLPGEGAKVVAIVGGPASGKGTLSERLATRLGRTAVLGTDNYAMGTREWRHGVEDAKGDPLTKYDIEYLNEDVRAILALKDGETRGIPIYDQRTGLAVSDTPGHRPHHSTYIEKEQKVSGRQDLVIVEGDFHFVDPGLLSCMIYLDLDDATREEVRVFRDITLRPEDPDPVKAEEKTRKSFHTRQESQFKPHTLPNRELADLVIKVNATPLAVPTEHTRFAFTYDLLPKAPPPAPVAA